MATSPHPTAPLVVDVDERQVAFFRANGYLAVDRITTDEELEWLREIFDEVFITDRSRRAYANEFQTVPVPRAAPTDRPWVQEGREAFEARSIAPRPS